MWGFETCEGCESTRREANATERELRAVIAALEKRLAVYSLDDAKVRAALAAFVYDRLGLDISPADARYSSPKRTDVERVLAAFTQPETDEEYAARVAAHVRNETAARKGRDLDALGRHYGVERRGGKP